MDTSISGFHLVYMLTTLERYDAERGPDALNMCVEFVGRGAPGSPYTHDYMIIGLSHPGRLEGIVKQLNTIFGDDFVQDIAILGVDHLADGIHAKIGLSVHFDWYGPAWEAMEKEFFAAPSHTVQDLVRKWTKKK